MLRPIPLLFAVCLPALFDSLTLGQKMVEWNQLDVASFLEQATGFLAEHGQLDGPSCPAPPAKRARSVGLPLFSRCTILTHLFHSMTPGISTVEK